MKMICLNICDDNICEMFVEYNMVWNVIIKMILKFFFN